MDLTDGYKIRYEKKKSIVYVRMDESMLSQLKMIGKRHGISISELVRQGIRKVFSDYSQK